MTTTVPMQPAPVADPLVLYQQGKSPSSLNCKAALITGYIQIGLSITSVIFGVACIALGYLQGYIAVPIWGGLGFYLVAGILGITAGHSKGRNSCAIIGCLVMSILAAVTAGVHITIGGISCAYDDYYYYRNGGDNVVNIITTLVGLAELIVAVVASAYMCGGSMCCCAKPTNPQYDSYVVESGQVTNQVAVQGYPMMQQPQVMGHPQQNVQYMPQAQAQLPVYTEHETKEVPQI